MVSDRKNPWGSQELDDTPIVSARRGTCPGLLSLSRSVDWFPISCISNLTFKAKPYELHRLPAKREQTSKYQGCQIPVQRAKVLKASVHIRFF